MGHTEFFVIAAIILFAAAIAIVSIKKEKYPYKKRKYLLNIPERKFFEWLEKTLPEEYVVFPQVVMSNIVKAYSSDKKEFWKYQNKINKKIIDFVIFTREYLQPILAIEYDGSTHNLPDRKKRDFFVDKVLETAGIGIIHIKHQVSLNYKEIEKDILQKLKIYS